MRPEQAQALFQQTLEELGGTGKADAALDSLANLTPGDFAAATRRLRSLQVTPTAAELLAELEAEVGVKAATHRRAGF